MQTYDPLAPYRKTPPAPASVVNPPQGPAEYIAYSTKDKVRRLRIRPATTATHSPGYNLLLNISYDGDHGTNIMLVFTVMMVMVQGKNLQKLVFALENDMAEYIQEFDPGKWAQPTDANAAVIESIEVKVTGGNGPAAEILTNDSSFLNTRRD